MVASALDTATHHVPADKIIRAISQGKWAAQVEQIRRVYARVKERSDRKAAKEAVAVIKKNLPAILFSGRFTQRNNEALIQHSGLLCADLDDLHDGKLADAREKLRESPYLWALSLSPTGTGLKAVYRVPADASKHSGSYRAIEKHVLDLTGIQIDEACKDPARLCFVSYDPDCYYNPDALEIEPLPEPQKPKTERRVKSSGQDGKPDKAQVRDMLAVIPKRPDYHDWIKVVAAVGDALPDDDDAIEVLNEWSPEEHPGEYAYKLRKGLKNVTIGTLIHLARQYGWTGNKIATTKPKPETPRVEVQPKGDVEPVELPPAPAPYVSPPLTLFPSQLQDYICAAAQSLNVNIAFILLPLLSSLGTAIGNSRSILLKRGFIQPPVIWTGIIARSGGRKSPSEQEGCFAVMEHERELMRQNKEAADILANRESKRRRREPKPEEPPFLTCTCDDLTIEVLADILDANPRGILVRKDELSHWLASFDQYKNAKGSDVSRWLSLHTAVSLAVDRKKDHLHYRIVNPRVCLTGGIQPRILSEALTPEFFERGLPARFVFAFPPFRQDRWSEATVPGDLRVRVLDLFSELWLLQPNDENPQLLLLTRDAKAVFEDFYNECGEAALEAGEHEEAAWGKLSGYGARFALIGQLARDPKSEIVAVEDMQAACELARWAGNEAVRIYATLGETQEQRELRELCEFVERRGGVATVRDTITFYWPLKNQSERAQQMYDQLVKSGRGKWEEVTPLGRGRPTRIFRLLPTSASAKIPELRGKTANCADADAPNSRKITPSGKLNTEAGSDELDTMPEGVLEL